MSIHDEITALHGTSDDGMLHAGQVVDWARDNPASALHGAFEWNDTRAANEYRLEQARGLIRLHIVVDDDGPTFVSLSFDRTRGGGYRTVADVVKSRDLSEILLRDALAELERVQKRYARVEALTAVWRAVGQVRRRSPRVSRVVPEVRAP